MREDPHAFAPFPKLIKGIGLNLTAWLVFTIMTDLIRYAQGSVHLFVILFFQNLVGFCIVLPLFLKNKTRPIHEMPIKLLLIRSIFGQLNMFLLFFAVKFTSLTDAMLLGNSAPLFIPFISLIWLKNKIKHLIWPGIILGFVGIFLILDPLDGGSLNRGSLYALLAGVCLGVILLSVRLLSTIEKTVTIVFFLFLIGLIIFTPLAIAFWTPFSFDIFLLVMLIAVLLLLGQYLLIKSLSFAETSQLSPFSYSVVIYALIIDGYLKGIVPSRMAFVGIFLFCLGGILTIFLTKQKKV